MHRISSVHLCLARARHGRLRVVVKFVWFWLKLYIFDLLAGTTSHLLWHCVKKIKKTLGWRLGGACLRFLKLHTRYCADLVCQRQLRTMHRWCFEYLICKPCPKREEESDIAWSVARAVKIRFDSGCGTVEYFKMSPKDLRKWLGKDCNSWPWTGGRMKEILVHQSFIHVSMLPCNCASMCLIQPTKICNCKPLDFRHVDI